MTIDILAALADDAPSRSSSRKCKIQRWLDSIADDNPGLAELTEILTSPDPKDEQYRSLKQILRVLERLGLTTSETTAADHRAKRCRCFH